MNIKTNRVGSSLVVELAGEIDLVTADVFRREVDTILDKDSAIKNLLLDLKEVSFIDSSGLGAILGRYRRLQKAGGRVVMVGLQPRVRKIFETAGLTRIIATYDSQAQALPRL